MKNTPSRVFSIATLVMLAALSFTARGQAAPAKGASAGDAPPQLLSTGPKWRNAEQLRRFAEQGDPQACFEWGDRVLNGDGVPADPAAARGWFEKAARGGVGDAMFRLGKMHFDGVGGPKNIEQALDYYTQAARLGIPEAQHNIGAVLVSGRGVKRDYPEGLAWLIVAEKNGAMSDAVARTRQHLAKRPADIAAAEQRAADLLAALKNPETRAQVTPRFSFAGALPAVPPPIAEPKSEKPGKVKVDLRPDMTAPKPEVTLPKN